MISVLHKQGGLTPPPHLVLYYCVQDVNPYFLFAEQLPHHHVPGAASTDAHVLLLTKRLHGSVLLRLLLTFLLLFPFHLRAQRDHRCQGCRQHRVYQPHLRHASSGRGHT